MIRLIMHYVDVLSLHLPERTGENHKERQSRYLVPQPGFESSTQIIRTF